ncbi:hypothetical protein ScPMuIL_004803 [Solemya velum]
MITTGIRGVNSLSRDQSCSHFCRLVGRKVRHQSMASKVSRNAFRALKGRLYSAQAAQQESHAGVSLPKQSPQVTKLPNGLIVASLENYSPIARVSVVANAGSRFENEENSGVTHCLRKLSGLSTNEASAFGITRQIQQIGGNISCASSREYMFYNVECIRDSIDTGVEILEDITTCPAFKPWEVSDAKPGLDLDLATLTEQPNVLLYELLHKVAYGDTLGQSLYAPNYAVGGLNPEQLMSYVRQHYTAGRMGLIGLGIEHNHLVSLGEKFKLFPSSGVRVEKAHYRGGEIRQGTNSNLSYAAIVTEGPSCADKDMLAASILQMVMGTGPLVKYGSNSSSKLGQAIAKATSQPFAVSSINANYTDSGLFGFYAVGQPSEIGKIMKAGTQHFASVTKSGITDKDVAVGKNQLKAVIAMAHENGDAHLTDMAEQVMGNEQITSLEELNKLIDAVTAADVSTAAKKIFNGKPSMAATGNLSHMPYLDQILK